MGLTYDESVGILDMKYIAGSTNGYTLPTGTNEISDLNLMLKSLLPKEGKENITIDDIRLRSNLTTKKTMKFTKKSFFSTLLGFNQSHLRPLGDIEGMVQKIPGTYGSKKPIYITGIDKIDLNCDCINGSIVNGFREPILFSFVLDKPQARKTYKEPRIKHF